MEPLPAPPTPPANAFSRGFVTGMIESNPQMTAETLEGLSHLAPETFRDTLATASKDLHGLIKDKVPDAYKRRAGSMWDIKGIDDALTWAGETVGQGIASTVPSVITGLGGAFVGSRIAGRPGAVVGGLGGATVPSAALNYGEVYRSLKDEKVDPKASAEYALYAAGPMVLLDTISIGPIVARLGGISIVRRELARNIARRIAAEGAKGAGREGDQAASSPVVPPAAAEPAAVSAGQRRLLRKKGYDEAQIDAMGAAEAAAELEGVEGAEDLAPEPAQDVPTTGVQTPPAPADVPTTGGTGAALGRARERHRGAAEDLKAGKRDAVWLPAATVDHLRAQRGLRDVAKAGVPLINFDGEGGLLVARDKATADAAIKARARAPIRWCSRKTRRGMLRKSGWLPMPSKHRSRRALKSRAALLRWFPPRKP